MGRGRGVCPGEERCVCPGEEKGGRLVYRLYFSHGFLRLGGRDMFGILLFPGRGWKLGLLASFLQKPTVLRLVNGEN